MMKNAFLMLLLVTVVVPSECLRAQETQKHPLLVLSDIEADPDDTQSLLRLLLYANRIDIEGLVATTSVHQKRESPPSPWSA